MLKTFVLLFGILVIGVFFRTFYWEGLHGTDFPYHYTVIEQSLEQKTLRTYNAHALCGAGALVPHPPGYYVVPYFLAKIVGITATFYLLPLLFGILSILLTYTLLATMYNRKTGLVGAFLLAISLAHITKTFPNTYRGEALIYPFLLLSLLFLYKCLTSQTHRWRFAFLAGLWSGIPAFFWNGYIFGIITFFSVVAIVILYKFFTHQPFSADVRLIGASFFVQYFMMLTAHLLFGLAEKGSQFLLQYYPFLVVGMLLFFAALIASRKVGSLYPLAVYVIVMGFLAYLLRHYLSVLLAGFGSLRSMENFAPELLPTSPYAMLYLYGALYFVFFMALVWIFLKMDHRAAFLLGFVIPALFAVASAGRFVFLSSVPIVAIAAGFLNNKKVVQGKFDLFVFLTVLVVIVQSVFIVYAAPRYFQPQNAELLTALTFLKENTPSNSCIATVHTKGAIIEMISKRFNYYNSLAFNEELEKSFYRFLLYGNLINTTEHFYVLLSDFDLLFESEISRIAGIPNPDFSYRLTYANPFLLYSRQFYTAFEIDNNTAYQIIDQRYYQLRYVYFYGKELYHNPEGSGCLYSNGVHDLDVYFGDKLCDTMLYKMVTGQSIPGTELVYFENGYAIYRLINYTSPSSKKEPQALFAKLPRDRA